MANTIDPMAASFGKKKEVVYDLMRGGAGTPWENRGEHGAAGGFLKTAFRSVINPGLLFDHIRSTTVTTDAERFLRICAVFWGVGIAVYRATAFFRIDQKANDVDAQAYLIVSALETIGGTVFAYVMLRLVITVYHKLVTTEIRQAVPATLTFNIAAYAMGASIFAIIPIVGPPIAVVGAFVSLVAAGHKRLFVSWRAAIIDALLAFVVAMVATIVVYFVGGFLLTFVFGDVTPREAGPVLPRV